MSDKVCIHCFVGGRVQGVWFRANTQKEAQQLGLTGWVRNTNDGRVELVACGPRKKVEMLLLWLDEGPEMAKVAEKEYEEVSWQDHDDFVVR